MSSRDLPDSGRARHALLAAPSLAWEQPASATSARMRRPAALLVHAIVLETLCGGLSNTAPPDELE